MFVPDVDALVGVNGIGPAKGIEHWFAGYLLVAIWRCSLGGRVRLVHWAMERDVWQHGKS